MRPDAAFVLHRLLHSFGPQAWWPAETRTEMMVGAVLTQNTAWRNVERAIDNLRRDNLLAADRLLTLAEDRLAELIRPAGFFRVKARRMLALFRWIDQQGGQDALAAWDTLTLRRGLLSVNGVGPETADCILLYGYGRPVFVIDAYTRRIFSRLGLVAGTEPYEVLRSWFESALPGHEAEFGEHHALLVELAKRHCRATPLCADCPLSSLCPTGHS